MIKNNIFGTILVLLMVVFLLVASIQMVGVGSGVKSAVVSEDINADLPKIQNAINNDADEKLDNTQLLNNIKDRPMFSDTRMPFEEEDLADTGTLVEDVVIEPLKAKLMGVVITPESSYAMIVDEASKKSEVYTVGMPLEGDQGGWSLTEITQRKVIFTSEDNEITELELEVFSGTAGPAKNSATPKVAGTNKATEDQKKLEKKKNADDIRKKIAERRAQMRADALKKK
jgi:type II secretory pathway component PulC